MDCRSVSERLSAHLDGELSAADADAVRRHVLTCSDCARAQSLLATTRRAFEPVHTGFDDEVFRRLRKRRASRWWLPAAAGLAAALSVFVFRGPMRPFTVLELGRNGQHPSASRAPVSSASDVQPGWSDGRSETVAADCGRLRAVVCRIETPCMDARCLAPALVGP